MDADADGGAVGDGDGLTRHFETQRGRLRGVAYRMLGSLDDADDAVQEAWVRLARADTREVANLDGWLTTVVARICLDQLRSRRARREQSLDLHVHVPDPIVSFGPAASAAAAGTDPETEALVGESTGLALLVVLDSLGPAERTAFVLHDVFAVPFAEIGEILGRSPAAAKQLASRARARVRGAGDPDGEIDDPARHHEVVEAFLAAARDGNFAALLDVLHPDVVLRADAGDSPLGPSRLVRGAVAVAEQAGRYATMARWAVRVTVNGRPGLLAAPGGQVVAVLALTSRAGRVTEIDILADPRRLERLGVTLPP